LQNGEMNVESELGKGTTFRFTIPYEIEIAADQNVLLQSPELNPGSISESYNIKILAVEDNEMNQSLLKHLFNEWGFSYAIVNNGIEAIKSLQSARYNLVLMDLQMPIMDGYTATQEIRTKLRMDIPIIAMTAHAFASEREKCLSYGMNEYIAKPIDETKLLKLITQFTGYAGVVKPLKTNMADAKSTAYKYIDLQYMYDISQGNKEYEKNVTKQFLEAIPADVIALESALKIKDNDTIKKTAHNMKTNVSMLGLSEKLQPLLDVLEYDPFDEKEFQQTILSIKNICMNAMPEARHFYSTL